MAAYRGDRVVVLIGHGSPRPQWRLPLDALAAALGGPEAGVHLAFMEHCDPSLASIAGACVEQGVTHLSVLPLFISSGGHVNREIRQQTDEVAAAHPELTVVTLPALGELDGVRAALSAIIDREISVD